MEHSWQEGEPFDFGVDVEQVDYCLVCGVGRFALTEGRLWLPIRDHLDVSNDCTIAQEQVRHFVQGFLTAAVALNNARWGFGSKILAALQDRTATLPNVLRALKTLLNGVPWEEDLDWDLKGGRPKEAKPPLDDIEL